NRTAFFLQSSLELRAKFLEDALDASQRTSSLLRDLRDLIPLDPQLDHGPKGRRQRLQHLGDDHLKEHAADLVLVRRLRLVLQRAHPMSEAQFSLGGGMKSGLGPNLVQSEYQKQSPQIASIWNVVQSFADSLKESTEDRLNQILWLDAAGEFRRTLGFCESFK